MLSHQRPLLYAMLCLLTLAILSGCRPQTGPRPAQRPSPTEPRVVAEQNWSAFTANARSLCEAKPGCSLDYDKLHEYGGRYFGVTVIGYKDSEYFVYLYRFDPQTKKWIESPRVQPEDDYEHIDVPKTSKQWNVPEANIQGWIDEAHKTVREIYSKRQ